MPEAKETNQAKEGAGIGRRFRVLTLDELLAEPDKPGDWGPWRLDPEIRVLYPVWPYRYEVDLDKCLSSAQVLDWVCQIAGKTWGQDPDAPWSDDAIVAGLVRALDDVLHPQGQLCSFGMSRRLSKRKIAALVRRAVEAGRVVL